MLAPKLLAYDEFDEMIVIAEPQAGGLDDLSNLDAPFNA